MQELWQHIQGPVALYGGRILGAILILLVGWVASRYLVAPVVRLANRSRLDPLVASFLISRLRTVLLVVIILAVLQQLGVETTSLLAVLGTAGLAVALSLQTSLANFASGLVVLSFRMVKVGDLIEVGDVRGRVTEMLPFHVVVVTADNQRITVPNTMLTNGPVRNNTALTRRRIQWTLALTPGENLDAVKDALRARLFADPRVLNDPAPEFYVQDWSDQKRTLVVTAWTATADYQAAQQDLLEALGAALADLRQKQGQ